VTASRSFDDLLAEASTVSVDGWDFSWLEGRATEARPSWGFQRMMSERLATSSALDIDTGGGEVLASAPRVPATMAASERHTRSFGYPRAATADQWPTGTAGTRNRCPPVRRTPVGFSLHDVEMVPPDTNRRPSIAGQAIRLGTCPSSRFVQG
jgi:hypothetical protein